MAGLLFFVMKFNLMMKKFVYTVILAVCFYTVPSCAQTKIPVVKADAFYTIPVPGTIAVDENGQPRNNKRDTVFSIFAETKETNINWEKAWTNGHSYSLTSVNKTNSKIEIGEGATKKITLTPQSGNTIWQLELSNDQKNEKPPQRLSAMEILLKGQWKNKSFFYKIKSAKELPSPMYQ